MNDLRKKREITFPTPTADFGTVTHYAISVPTPRWPWCRYLPKRWKWAWPVRIVASGPLPKAVPVNSTNG